MKLLGIQIGGAKPAQKNLNQLIFDIAEHNREADIQEIFQRLPAIEMLTPIVSASFEIKAADSGRQRQIGANEELKIRTQSLQGRRFVQFLVNQDDARLGDNFIGMTVAEVFAMIEKDTDLAGLIFYNDRDSYLAIGREQFAMLRRDYGV